MLLSSTEIAPRSKRGRPSLIEQKEAFARGRRADIEIWKQHAEAQYLEVWLRPIGEAERLAFFAGLNKSELPGVEVKLHAFVRCHPFPFTMVHRELWLCPRKLWDEIAIGAQTGGFREPWAVDYLLRRGAAYVGMHEFFWQPAPVAQVERGSLQ